MPRRIDISHKTIIFIAVFILALWLLYLIRDLLLIVFVAVILMSALSPLVKFFTKLGLPKGVGILITYIIILAGLGTILAGILPPLIEQSTRLVTSLPTILSQQFGFVNIDQTIVQQELTAVSKDLLSWTLIFVDNLLTIIFLLVLTFYMLLERENLEKRTAELFIGKQERVRHLVGRVEEKLGSWVRGQLLLSLVIGATSYLGLTVLSLPYALPLALLAGIMEVVPVIGPIIAAIPAVALGLTISPVTGAGVAAMYFVLQQLESHVVVPQIMKRAVGLNPLIVILAIAIGGRLLGISGALLAVPIAVVIEIIVADILAEKNT